MPKRLSPAADQFFHAFIMQKGLRVATTGIKTVNYHNTYVYSYLDLGGDSSTGAKELQLAEFFDNVKFAGNVWN